MSLVPLQGIRRYYPTEERSLYTVKKKKKDGINVILGFQIQKNLMWLPLIKQKKTEINKIKKNVKNDT